MHGRKIFSSLASNEFTQVVEILGRLEAGQARADQKTYGWLLQVCGRLNAVVEGKRTHSSIIFNRLENNEFLLSNLVNMYCKCGCIEDAQMLLERKPNVSVFTWASVMKACKDNQHYSKALELFQQMQIHNVRPSSQTMIPLLSSCTHLDDLEAGKKVHSYICHHDLEADVVVSNSLISMYGKCGSLEDAEKVFNRVPCRDVVSWNAMIASYARLSRREDALRLLWQMPNAGIQPNSITYTIILTMGVGLLSLEEVKLIHEDIKKNVMDSNAFLATSLVNIYGKYGSLKDAKKVFDKLSDRNVVSWTAMLAVYTQNGYVDEALVHLQDMHLEGVKPNSVTFVSMLNGCAELPSVAMKIIRSQIIETGLELDDVLGTSLMRVFSKFNDIDGARRIFDKLSKGDVVSWNAIIAVYVQHSCSEGALSIFKQMNNSGIKPNGITFITLLNAFSNPSHLAKGRLLHSYACEMEYDDVILENAFMTMYSKCGSLQDARKMFDAMQLRDIVTWNAMIAAYAQQGYSREVIVLFLRLEAENVRPNNVTFLSVLDASSTLAEGKLLHAKVIEYDLESDLAVGNAIINMYGKFGNLLCATAMFEKIKQQNVISWSALIAAYAQNGQAPSALKLFGKMQHEGVKPNQITFVSVLSACNHAGELYEGCGHFVSMMDDYGIRPTTKHYGCIVDLLGRSGRLVEAERMIHKMPIQADLVVWMALLGACRNNKDLTLGKRCVDHIIKIDPSCSSAYIVLSNLYSAAGKWQEAANVRKLMLQRGVSRDPGCSAIELDGKMYEFVTGDKSHFRTQEIYDEIARLNLLMKEAGYVPDTELIMHDVSAKEKEVLLSRHSEKLAIALGLITSPQGTSLRIVKNLRVCGDCHTATKLISKIVGREIIVRDASRYHHFVEGICTCNDYW